jgi:hypothetical protein
VATGIVHVDGIGASLWKRKENLRDEIILGKRLTGRQLFTTTNPVNLTKTMIIV